MNSIRYYGIRGRGYIHAECWEDYEHANTVRDALERIITAPTIESGHFDASGIARGVCLHCGRELLPAEIRVALRYQNYCETLARISGLHVYTQLGTRYFVFDDAGRTVKTVCTYRKAKLFAQGVTIGRNLALTQGRQ